MVYHNTENGASLQKLTDKSQISRKTQWISLSEIGKKESKTLNTLQKLLEEPSYNQSMKNQSSGGNINEETDQELDISGNNGTINTK